MRGRGVEGGKQLVDEAVMGGEGIAGDVSGGVLGGEAREPQEAGLGAAGGRGQQGDSEFQADLRAGQRRQAGQGGHRGKAGIVKNAQVASGPLDPVTADSDGYGPAMGFQQVEDLDPGHEA